MDAEAFFMPNISNSVYSMHMIPYSHCPKAFLFSIRTLIPSVAAEFRSHAAKPSF